MNFYFTKNPNLKFNVFGGGGNGRGRGSVAMVSDFFYKEPKSKKNFFLRWGRMAWVIDFLQIIQI